MVSSLRMKLKLIINNVHFFILLFSSCLLSDFVGNIEVCEARIGHQILPSCTCNGNLRFLLSTVTSQLLKMTIKLYGILKVSIDHCTEKKTPAKMSNH